MQSKTLMSMTEKRISRRLYKALSLKMVVDDRCGLDYFHKIDRIRFVAELLATYNPKKKKSVVGGLTVNVNRGALAIALKLPDTFVDAPHQDKMPPVNSDVDHASFLHKFVMSVMYARNLSNAGDYSEGALAIFRFCGFYVVTGRARIAAGVRYQNLLLCSAYAMLDIKTCYFARHMRCLVRSQHPELYEAGGDHVKKISKKRKTQPSKKRKRDPNESQAAEPSKTRSSRKKIVPEQGMGVNEPSKTRSSRKRKVPEESMGVVGSESQPEMGVVGSESQPRMPLNSLKRHPHKSRKSARNIRSCLLSGDSSNLPVDDEYFRRGSVAEEEPPITTGKDTTEDTDNGLRDEMEYLSRFS